MDFLKKHVEKVLFLLLLIGLAVSVFIAMSAQNRNRGKITVSPNAGKVEMLQDTAKVGKLIAQLQDEPMQLTVVTNAFTPAVRVICMNPEDRALIPKSAKICPYCGYEQTVRERDSDGDGISDGQEAKWGLNLNDPTDVHLDQDADGFPTLLEFQLGFDPTDPQAYPPLINYVRLENVVESSIEFELRGIAKFGDAYTLQLYWKYPDETQGRTDYIKVGKTFGRNNEFLAKSYTEKRTLIEGKYIDQSVAVIESGRGELKLGRIGEARNGKVTESTATLKLIMGPEWTEVVRVNEKIELDKESYIIVDINTQTVLLKPDVVDTESAETITIIKASQEELDALKPPETELMYPDDEIIPVEFSREFINQLQNQ